MTLRRLALLFCLYCASPLALGWDDARLATPVVIDGRVIPYPVFAMFFLPGQRFEVSFRDATGGGQLRFNDREMAVGSGPLTAPDEPGIYPLHIDNIPGGESATINIVVMVPADEVDANGFLNGYRIGNYPARPLRGNPIYRAPQGFVEVTQANRDTPVSPNFTLGQFLCKQAGRYPKYMVLRANLLLKLERILEALNSSGRPTSGLVIMSGYRTPWYNHTIGNGAYSRHLWGGAADFYVDDNPRDGRMDDLNGDGQVNRADATWLGAFIEDMSRRGDFGERVGGLGVYGANSAHGPFVHVDVRGSKARW
jgi:hypothetical protein